MSLVGKEMIDYSAGVPSPAAIKEAGNIGVVRYVSPAREPWMKGKPLTRHEADALKAAGLVIVSNWQMRKGGDTTSDYLRGANGASEDYPIAQQIHEEAGGHPDGVIYVSIDANPNWSVYEKYVRPYLARWQELIGRERLGVYCNARVIGWCLKDELGSWFWQHNWSGDSALNGDHYAAHIHQYAIDSGEIDGVGVDDNRILKDPFGQWGTEIAPPPQTVELPPAPPEENTVNAELDRIEGMRGRWVGDPVWLVDVLRLWGLRVDLIGDPDPFLTGHGDFQEVVGVMLHHTAGGGVNDWRIVKWGRAGLAGPLSQLVLEKDGSIKFVAVGVAWHAGSGAGSRWAEKFGTDGNWRVIGVEAVSRGTEIDGRYDWTDEQLYSYRVLTAAIAWFLRKDSSWACGHREYNLTDGKIDPAGIDLNTFRAEVQHLIDGGPLAVATTPGGGTDLTGPPTPPLTLPEGKTGIENERDVNPGLGDRDMVERELPCPDGVGRYCHYVGGSIYWTPERGAIAVFKPIYDRWASLMWEVGLLGYPKEKETQHEDGRWQEFDNGTITFRAGDERAWPVIGGIRDDWIASGGVNGRYGWPQSREYPHPSRRDVVVQDYSEGKILWRMGQGAIGDDDFDVEAPPE